MGDAAASPLKDFNLARPPIPAILVTAQKAPYAVPLKTSCDVLAAEIKALDAVLGADLDAPSMANNADMTQRGVDAAGDAAVGAFRSTVENLVPFRGWIRKLSGADQYERDAAAALGAGTIRRAFLKGIGETSGCKSPAAPRK